MLAYVRPMLACVGLGWAYVGPTLAYVGHCVEPSWTLCWAYVGDMLAILGLCRGYVRKFYFYTSHTRNTVNYVDISEPEVTRGSPRFGDEGRRQGARPYPARAPGGPKAVSLP